MQGNSKFTTDLKPVWCRGCGNFGLYAALTRNVFPSLGLEKDKIFVVSGIGCASRIPGYMDTYGLNGLHGRSLAIAQGAKLARPELTVLAVGGDGDFFSIGAGHLPHAVRRNFDITCIMVNNFVYALTKGQTSPTTPSAPPGDSTFLPSRSYPPVNPLLDMLSYSVSTEASFIAQSLSTDIPHLSRILTEAIAHPGFSLVGVLSPCVTFNPPHLFASIKDNASYLVEGEPVKLPETTGRNSWLHDPGDMAHAMALARIPITEMPFLGVLYRGAGPQ